MSYHLRPRPYEALKKRGGGMDHSKVASFLYGTDFCAVEVIKLKQNITILEREFLGIIKSPIV